MSISGSGPKATNKPKLSMPEMCMVPEKQSIENKSESKNQSIENKDGFKTVTEHEKQTRTVTSGGPRPSQTTYSRERMRKTRTGVKRDGSSIEGAASYESNRSASVRHHSGGGQSIEATKKELEGGYSLYQTSGSVSGDKSVGMSYADQTDTSYGTINQSGHVKAGVSAKADGSVQVSTKSVQVKGAANVKVGADGSYTIKFRSKQFSLANQKVRADFEVTLSAAAVAEAGGSIEVAAKGNPPKAVVSAGGKAFAGVSAGADMTASLTWIKHGGDEVKLGEVSGGVSARAGVGAEFKLDVGYSDGKITLDAYAGASLGIGASGRLKGELNFWQAAKFAAAVGEEAGRRFVSGGEEIIDYAKKNPSSFLDISGKVLGDLVTSPLDSLSNAWNYYFG